MHTLHAMSSSKEKLLKLSKTVSNLDPKAVVGMFSARVVLHSALLDLMSIDSTLVVACIEDRRASPPFLILQVCYGVKLLLYLCTNVTL